MLRLVRPRAFAAFALAALAVVSWTPGERASASRQIDVFSRPTFEANTLVAALPEVLTQPTVRQSWHLVSMVANDIDADGDLDVVASDGSLELIVWINDGTGRLTRQANRPSSEVRPEVSGPALATEPVESSALVHSPFSLLQPRSSIGSVLSARSRPRSDDLTDALQPALVSIRIPRAPPASSLLS